MTCKKGTTWIRNHVGNALLHIGSGSDMIMGLFGASGMVPTNADVLLPEGFSEYTLTHEMGHVFDNNIKNGYLPATYNGGGLQMQWWLRWAVILIGVSRDFNVGLNDFQQTIFGTKLMWQDQMHGI